MRGSSFSSHSNRETFPWLWITLLMAIGAYIRLDFLIASDFVIDADEAIVGLMGQHIANGAATPVFYYGQHYMGTLEPLLVGTLFSWLGFYPAFLKLVPFIFSLLLIGVLAAIGFELGGRRVAILTGLLSAAAPATLIVWSSKARGGFIEIVFIGALVTLFSLWWLRDKEFQWGRLAIISFLLGFGWWTNNQIVFFYPAVGLMILWKCTRVTNEHFWGLSSTAVLFSTVFWLMGGLPFWLYNVLNDFATFSQLMRSHEASLAEHVVGLFQNALPIILGGKRYWQQLEVFSFSTFFSYLLSLISLFGVAGLFVAADTIQRARISFLICTALTTIVVFVLSPYGYLSEAPRYLLPLYVPLLPLTALGITFYFQYSKIFTSLLIVSFFSLHLASSYLHARAIPGEPFVYKGERVSRDHAELYDFLKKQQIQWVRTNYWIGYRVAYETEEQVRFVVFQEPLQRRIPDYEKLGKQQGIETIPFLLVPAQAKIVEEALELLGVEYQKQQVSGYVLLYDLKPLERELRQVNSLVYNVQTSDQPQKLSGLDDGDLNTRWGSGRPQAPDMEIRIDFQYPLYVEEIEYLLGKWVHDYPRQLEIEGVRADGSSSVVLTPEQYQSLRYIAFDDAWKIRIPRDVYQSLIFRQKGSDSFFDWSVAELRLYGSYAPRKSK